MEKVIQFFDTFEEADKADKEYYRTLTPEERIEIGLELMKPYYEAHPRLERIYRTFELGECPSCEDKWMGS